MMFRLSLKTNASLVSLFLLSSAPMALSYEGTRDDSDIQKITKTPPPATVVLNPHPIVQDTVEPLDPMVSETSLSATKELYHIRKTQKTQGINLKTYFIEGFPDHLRTLFPFFGTPHDQLSSFCVNNVTTILSLLRKLPESNSQYFQDFRALFPTKDNKAEEYHGLLKHCSRYTDFISEKMYGAERAHIIEALGKIPDFGIRNEIVKQAPKFFTKTMNGYHRAKIIKALGKITDPEIRGWIVAQAPKLFTEDMDGLDRAQIIKAFGTITDFDMRNWVVEQAPKLFMDNMDGWDIAHIIEALGKIPDFGIRNEIVKQAPKFFTKTMNGYHRAKIIKALGNITDLGIRNEVVAQALKIFTEDMGGKQRVKIIQKYAAALAQGHEKS